MDAKLLETIIISTVALVLGVPVLKLLRSGKIATLAAGKDGLQLNMNAADKRDESRYFMDRRIAEIDDNLKIEARAITQSLRKPILRAVASAGLCTSALRAVAGDLRGPMYQSTDENDFKHRLSLKNRAEYVAQKLAQLRDEYVDLVSEASIDPCAIGPTAIVVFPLWDAIAPDMEKMLNAWTEKIVVAVLAACRKKIAVYEEYKPRFEAAKDEYFSNIVANCIAKNQEYIKGLGGED